MVGLVKFVAVTIPPLFVSIVALPAEPVSIIDAVAVVVAAFIQKATVLILPTFQILLTESSTPSNERACPSAPGAVVVEVKFVKYPVFPCPLESTAFWVSLDPAKVYQ